jgi:hypothetical protein
MRHRQDRHLVHLGEIRQRFEQGPHIGRTVTVDLAHVARDRVDNDKLHIAHLLELLTEKFKVTLQTKGSTRTLGTGHCSKDMNAVQIRASHFKPGPQGIGHTILSRQNDR